MRTCREHDTEDLQSVRPFCRLIHTHGLGTTSCLTYCKSHDHHFLCRCQKNFSKYTCPRCNLQYCCLDCYKKHGDRCTEGFYRYTNTSSNRRALALSFSHTAAYDKTLGTLGEAYDEAIVDRGGINNSLLARKSTIAC